jgi:adenylate cyclase 8
MLPLPLKWCMIGGTITAITHISITTFVKFQQTKGDDSDIDTSCVVKQMVANTLLYVAINFAGMYTKYLTDRGQRLAFIETHKAMEHKKESEKEYQKTQRLLDSSKTALSFSISFLPRSLRRFDSFDISHRHFFPPPRFHFRLP